MHKEKQEPLSASANKKHLWYDYAPAAAAALMFLMLLLLILHEEYMCVNVINPAKHASDQPRYPPRQHIITVKDS